MNNNEYDQEPLTYEEVKPARVAIQEQERDATKKIEFFLRRLEENFNAIQMHMGVIPHALLRFPTEASRTEAQHWVSSELSIIKDRLNKALETAIEKVLAVK